MSAIPRCCHRPVVLLTCLVMSGCVGMDPAILTGLPGDILAGRSAIQDLARRPTNIYDVQRKVQGAAFIIATVQKYAVLTASQKRQVEQVVTRKYNGYVQQEKKKLAPQYNKQKAEARKRAVAKAGANPAKADAEVKKEVEKVDLEWEKAARTSVAKNYGTDFAVPVQNPDGKTVVAFASVKNSGVSVSSSSYEVASPVTAGKGTPTVAHSGKQYAVLNEKITQ